jgi:hypothetical protein
MTKTEWGVVVALDPARHKLVILDRLRARHPEAVTGDEEPCRA